MSVLPLYYICFVRHVEEMKRSEADQFINSEEIPYRNNRLIVNKVPLICVFQVDNIHIPIKIIPLLTMNHPGESIKICPKCGQGAPTKPNDKVTCLVMKVCTSCEQNMQRNDGVGVRDVTASDSSTINSINLAAGDGECAACGKSGDNLKACIACKQVKYCNVSCQKSHWPKHKKECKIHSQQNDAGSNNSNSSIRRRGKRDIWTGKNCHANADVGDINVGLGEMVISDDILFQEPPPKEDCPICFLPMPYTGGLCGVGVSYAPCCGKVLCSGCIWASVFATGKGALKKCCAFCREPTDSPIEEETRKCKKRMEAGDAETFHQEGIAYENGDRGVPRDKNKALEMWNRAADFGHADAHHHIADAYLHGKGVEKDDDKASYHLERAAIRGHEMARYSLGINEYNDGNMNQAMKHFMISARAGYDEPLKRVMDGYKWGIVTKEEYASTLRAHKGSQDEMKSEQRSTAERFYEAREITKEMDIKNLLNKDDKKGLEDYLSKMAACGVYDEKGRKMIQ